MNIDRPTSVVREHGPVPGQSHALLVAPGSRWLHLSEDPRLAPHAADSLEEQPLSEHIGTQDEAITVERGRIRPEPAREIDALAHHDLALADAVEEHAAGPRAAERVDVGQRRDNFGLEPDLLGQEVDPARKVHRDVGGERDLDRAGLRERGSFGQNKHERSEEDGQSPAWPG